MTTIPARDWFSRSSDGFLDVLDHVGPSRLDDPALGVWDIRDLVGHTSRSFLTIETYLAGEPAPDARLLASAADYYRAAHAVAASPEVAERGRVAGRALGDEPVTAVRGIVARVRSLVDATPDDARVASPFGTMRLGDYLPTRAFEVTVHGIDLARALGVAVPPGLLEATAPALDLCVSMADPGRRTALLMAATGREPLPQGFSVL